MTFISGLIASLMAWGTAHAGPADTPAVDATPAAEAPAEALPDTPATPTLVAAPAVATVSILDTPVTGPLTADDVVARVQAFYEKTIDYSAEFDQTYTYKVYKRKKESKGRVYFKKPGKMRWEYSSPEPKVFVGDGTTLWVYDPAAKSVLKSSMSASTLPTSITFLMGTGDLRSEFRAKLLKDHPLASDAIYVLELDPIKDHGHYQKVQLVVSAKSFMVLRTIVFDPTGNVNDIKFRGAKIDASVADSVFKFDVPPGVEVITGD